MFKKIAAILAFGALLAYSAVNYPYPQRKNYPGGTISVPSASASGDLKAKFTSYWTKFYEEGNCSGTKDCARIKFYDPDKPRDEDYTVSEGIGYGMLLAVYFSDATKSYEEEFKKLWAYYKKFSNNNGLMNWKINGFSGPTGDGTGSASDADFDVALALVMARYQFDVASYETEAKTLIAAIRSKDFDNNYLHLPGDSWGGSADNNRNPSYVAPAAFQIFKEVEGNTAWDNIITKNYSFLTTNRNGTTGLPSDWANSSGTPVQCSACGYSGTKYGQDAVRAPWRWATAKAWYNHTQATDLLNKLAGWLKDYNAADVKGPVELGGGTNPWGNNANSSYTGSLMNALMAGQTYQTKLNEFWSVVSGISESSYYNHSMQLLTGLLATGNMPNLKACASTAGCGTNMSNGGGSAKDYTSLSKFDWFGFTQGTEEENMAWGANLEAWYAYTDEGSHGASTITNEKFPAKDENDGCKEIQSYRAVMKDGSEWVAKIPSYTFVQGNNRYAPFVALGLAAKKNGAAAAAGGYDLSGCTGGFSYQYKGQGHNFKVQDSIVGVTGADYFKAVTVATTAWTERVIEFSDLAQPSWAAAANKHTFDAKLINGFIWELKGPDAKNCPAANLDASKGDNYCLNAEAGTVDGGISKNTGSLAIKDFRCLGKVTLPAMRTNPCGEDAIVEGPGDDDGGYVPPDPIISRPYAANSAFAVRNGVNLQISKKAVVEIFSLNGKSVSKREFSNGNHTLMLNDLPKGLYIVKVQFGSQREMLRVPVR